MENCICNTVQPSKNTDQINLEAYQKGYLIGGCYFGIMGILFGIIIGMYIISRK
jgi:hypothetical protein